MIIKKNGTSSINGVRFTQEYKNKNVADLDRAELTILVDTVKSILKFNKDADTDLVSRVKQVYIDDINHNGPLDDRHYFVAKRVIEALTPETDKSTQLRHTIQLRQETPNIQEVALTPRILGILMPPAV